jgi:hypothetical protein
MMLDLWDILYNNSISNTENMSVWLLESKRDITY